VTTREPDFSFEAPIWWDPKVRSSIWDPKTFRLGLLLVRGRSLLVVTARGVLVSGDLDDARADWPAVFALPMCDLTISGTLHRLYFCSPHPRGPQFHARIPRAVAAVMEAREGGRVRLEAARVPPARWPSQVTEYMGRKRMQAFREVLAGPERAPTSNDNDVTQRDERATPRDERAGSRSGDAPCD
jgi:hypothetical protein